MNMFLFHIIKLLVYVIYLLIAIFFCVYNWLYLSKALNSSKETGIAPPAFLHTFIKTTKLLPFITIIPVLGVLLLEVAGALRD